MTRIDNALKEWAGVVDALTTGKQVILVRTFAPKNLIVALHPSFSYASGKTGNIFQARYEEFAIQAGLTVEKIAHDQKIISLKSFIEVNKVIKLPRKHSLEKIEKHSIWTKSHVDGYVNKIGYQSATKTGYLWIVRCYHLKPATNIPYTGGGAITYYPLVPPVQVSKPDPVMSDKEFGEKVNGVLADFGEGEAVDLPKF